jgi:DNA-binding NtrC family response regulator
LTSAGFSVTATDTFDSAHALLTAQPPSVLLTEIRLGIRTGLHLALLARSSTPDMTVIVMSRFHDPDMQRHAEALGATFVRKPMTKWELFAALYRAALRAPRPNETVESNQPLREFIPTPRRETAAARPDEQERRYRRRRRDIATFLLLEASRR